MLRVVLGLITLMAVFGPESEPAAPRYGVNPTPHYNAVAASNGAGQLLVGYEDRRGDDSLVSRGDNIHFTRVTPSGTLLDPGGIQLAVPGPGRHQITIASDGRDYLVAWAESTAYRVSELRIARIGADGTVLQGPTLISKIDATEIGSPHVCWDGSQHRMVFAISPTAGGVATLYTVRLTAAGAPVAPPAPIATPANFNRLRPTLACLGNGDALLAWWEYNFGANPTVYDVRAAPWPATGEPGAPVSIMLPGAGSVQDVALAAGGDRFLAVWDEQRGGSAAGLALVGQVLTRAGARTSASDIALAPAAPTGHVGQLAFDGTAWRVLARQQVGGRDQVFAGTVAADGTVAQPLAALTSGTTRYAPSSATCAGASCFATFTDVDSYVALGTRLGATNAAIDAPPIALSQPSDEQSAARLAWDGEQVLVAWASRVGRATPELFVRRMNAAGAWLDPAPLTLGPTSGFMLTALPEGGFAFALTVPNTQTSKTDLLPAFVARDGQVKRAATITSYSSIQLYGLSCLADDCHLFVGISVSSYGYRIDHQGTLAPGVQPQPILCERALAVGAETWCLAETSSGRELTLTRYDRALAAIGSPLMLSQANERPDVGSVMLADAGAVTVLWSAIYTNATTQAQSRRVKVARIGADGQFMVSPRDLPVAPDGYAVFPQRLIKAAGTSWLFWYGNDGGEAWRLRLQELRLSDLTLTGPVAELGSGGLELAYIGIDALTTAGDEVVLSTLALDPAPDRGSHRVRLRLTVAGPTMPDAGVDAPVDGPPDAGVDAAVEMPPPPDAGFDGGVESAPEPGAEPPPEPRADAGAAMDAPVDRGAFDSPKTKAGGCGCRTADGTGTPGAALAWLGILLATGLRARRRHPALALRRDRARKSIRVGG